MNKLIKSIVLFFISLNVFSIEISLSPQGIEHFLNEKTNNIFENNFSTRSFGLDPDKTPGEFIKSSDKNKIDLFIAEPHLKLGKDSKTAQWSVKPNPADQSIQLKLENTPLEFKTDRLFIVGQNLELPLFPKDKVPFFSAGTQKGQFKDLSIQLDPSAYSVEATLRINHDLSPPQVEMGPFEIKILDPSKIKVHFESISKTVNFAQGGASFDKTKLSEALKKILLSDPNSSASQQIISKITEGLNASLPKKIQDLLTEKLNPQIQNGVTKTLPSLESDLNFVVQSMEITQEGQFVTNIDYCQNEGMVEYAENKPTENNSALPPNPYDLRVILGLEELNTISEDLRSSTKLGEQIPSYLKDSKITLVTENSQLYVKAQVETPERLKPFLTSDPSLNVPVDLKTDGAQISAELGKKTDIHLPLKNGETAQVHLSYDSETGAVRSQIDQKSLNSVAETLLTEALGDSFIIGEQKKDTLSLLGSNELRISTTIKKPILDLSPEVQKELQGTFHQLETVDVQIDLKATYEIKEGEMVFSFVPYPTSTLLLPNTPASLKSNTKALGARFVGLFREDGAEGVIQDSIQKSLQDSNIRKKIQESIEESLKNSSLNGNLFQYTPGVRPLYSQKRIPELEKEIQNLQTKKMERLHVKNSMGAVSTKDIDLKISEIKDQIRTLDVKKPTQISFKLNEGLLYNVFTKPLQSATTKIFGSPLKIQDIKNTPAQNSDSTALEIGFQFMEPMNKVSTPPYSVNIQEAVQKGTAPYGAPINLQINDIGTTGDSIYIDADY